MRCASEVVSAQPRDVFLCMLIVKTLNDLGYTELTEAISGNHANLD